MPAGLLAAAQDEKRRAFRQRVLLGGKIVFEHGCMNIDCTLRNLSLYGAKLILPPGSVTPDRFEMIEMRNGKLYDCRVIWREYPYLGVAFEKTIDLQDAAEPHHRTLKRLWLDCLVR